MDAEKKTIREYDVIVVGAGFAGLYMLYRLREMGLKTLVLEAGEGVGGTWFWNRYPGARCDVESMEYSFSFDEDLQKDWNWTEKYATQPEILKYLEHVAERFELYDDIRLSTRVASMELDEPTATWTVSTEDGDVYACRYAVMATGCLSSWRMPEFAGQSDYEGEIYHTGAWPHGGVDFSGKRVGVIGTGSSGIQAIPEIGKQAAQMTVFQRTANFSVPARNRLLEAGEQDEFKARYPEVRAFERASFGGTSWKLNPKTAAEMSAEEQEAELRRRWDEGGAQYMFAFADSLVSEETNAIAQKFIRERIKEIVKDPATAELLCPNTHPIGSKRICVDTNYYATFNEPHVDLVNLRATPLDTITAKGIRTADGVEREFDAIVFATGFDAMTGALERIEIRGREGVALKDKWKDGPTSYLGLAVAGFPNMFTITGPGSPSVLSNMVVSIEQHVDWIVDCLKHLDATGFGMVEAQQHAEDGWVRHASELAHMTLFPKAASWYMGANVPGKPRVFMPYVGGVGPYRQRCDEIASAGYPGFSFAVPAEAEAEAPVAATA